MTGLFGQRMMRGIVESVSIPSVKDGDVRFSDWMTSKMKSG